jgi:N-acetylmuramoyl-L-alanine amidase
VQKVVPAAVQQEQLRIKQLEELRSALTFVGVSLVDQEGRPVPGEPFRVEFPGGAVKRGVTGGDGTVKVPGSKEGTAKVTFTRLDPAAWGKAGEKKRQPSSSAVAMKRHVVRQGECLASIARRHGASEAMRVYQDPANAGLRKLRPNPHVLNPGDVVAVPQAKPKTVDCQTRQTHQFVVTLPKRKLRMKLRDPSGEPLPNTPYRIVAGSLELEGKTDGSGVMEKEIPANATGVELHAHGVVRHLRVAGLNPLKEVEDGGLAGVQARLRNLGYDPGTTEGQLGPETAAAIEAFQRDRGLAPTGEIDEALLSALRSGHEV